METELNFDLTNFSPAQIIERCTEGMSQVDKLAWAYSMATVAMSSAEKLSEAARPNNYVNKTGSGEKDFSELAVERK